METLSSTLLTQVQSNNQLALNILRSISSTQGNCVYSPHSIALSLALTYSGARESTASEMAQALCYSLTQPEVAHAFTQLQQNLDACNSTSVSLLLNNSMWLQQGYQLLPEYLAILHNCYHTKDNYADYINNPKLATQKINQAVAQLTQGKIQTILSSNLINPLTRLVLINTCFLEARWQHCFEKDGTRDNYFHTTADHKTLVPTMRQLNHFNYLANDLMQMVELPYEKSTLSCYILMPTMPINLFINELTLNHLQQWQNQAKEALIKLYLPRFKLTYAMESLAKVLKSLGMQEAFDYRKANFSGMTGNDDLFISHISSQATIELTEELTTASAATAVIIELRCLDLTPPNAIELKINKPFLFIIKDKLTQSFLFIGKIFNPST